MVLFLSDNSLPRDLSVDKYVLFAVLIYRQMLFQCLHIGVRIAAEYHVFLADETDAHAAFHLERPRDNARTRFI